MAGNNGPKIVTSGLVLALDAADKKSYSGSGTAWNDLTANRNHFTLYNSPTFANNYGGEIQFDGLNHYARSRNNTIVNSMAANGTVEIWCRSYTGSFLGGRQSYCRLISLANDTGTGSDSTSTQGTNNDYNDYYILTLNNGAEYFVLFYRYGYGGPGGFGSTTTLNTNLYVQVVMNWSTSGGNMTFNHYVNGSNVATQTYGVAAYSTANNITLAMNSNGSITNPTETIKAAYSIVRLYNRTLSALEIKQNFDANRRRFGV